MTATSNPTVVLHGARTGNCLRASLALEEAGLPYTVRHVDLRRGEHRGPAHLKLNPAGLVPVLVVSEPAERPLVITQSNAIMIYASEREPGTLLPDGDAIARIRAIERFFFFVTDIVAPGMCAFRLGGRHDDAAAYLNATSLSALSAAEAFLASEPFMAGARSSLADLAAFTAVHAREANLDWPTLPRLREWYERMGSKSSVQRGMRAFDRPKT